MKKNENNVSFRILECHRKNPLDWIKQVRKTLFKTIATKERHCCNSWGWTGGIRNIAQIKLNSTANKDRRVFKRLSELVGKYRKTLVGRLEFFIFYFSVQFSSVTQSCPTLCDPMNHRTPGLPVHHQLPELTQSHVHQVGDAIQPSHPLPPILPSIRVFTNESTLRMRWPKYWSFSLSISPSNEYPGLISFRIDWLDFYF